MLELDRKRKREYLEILGIDQDNIDEEVVKKAYRKLALEFHPDRPNNKHKKEEAEVMFKKVTEAYEALQNNNKSLNVLKNVFKSHQDITSSLEHFFVTTGGNSNLSKLGGSSHNLHNMFQNYVNGQSSTQNPPTTESSSNATSPSTSSTSSLSSFSSLNIPLGGLNGANFNINLANGSKSNLSKPIPKKGQSLQTTLKITMEESLYGCTKTIEFTRSVTCANCDKQPIPIKPVTNTQCRDCGGKGVLTAVIAGGSVTTACPSCHAAAQQNSQPTTTTTSKDSKEPCTKCNGVGRNPNKRTVMVNVAPGVTNGMQQLYEGEGDEGTFGGPFGDLIVKFDVEPHPFYQRHGDDAMCKVTIPFPHAVLGTMIEIPLIYGALQSTPSGISISSSKMAVQIDPGVQQNQVVKVSQQGFLNSIDGKRGDLYIQILVDVPPKSALDEEERELLRKLANKPNFKFGKHNGNSSSILACSLLEEGPPPAKVPATTQVPLSPIPQRMPV
mmetsp:Transcript_8571/g.11850  ORF Transcript_8571/g.11850 Transcript_8571/m.11850 type:complete len:499 (+) Transcript_8571:226-1722(+)|eukprot:CAMPEP_0168565466 /NCGR_PEP_ID=MMETSP0413-20121227/13860_1 /TAXON_ID=136452 /ORGANISM="Filamoeba nolandi, Strain NC-AS-23-1" /LENGTH=498 /DNA_ID=CAMNT_0008597339 /DNA_START=147 /DNA_END=1643 /DNA_ORIENTATION=+